MDPAIFFDRDGVIIENKADYIRDWLEVKLIPGALRALSLLANTRYKIVIVTNQSAVGRGIISLETAREVNERLLRLIQDRGGRVDGLYMCPHQPADDCLCRKPRPGLLLQAAQELGLDLKSSWMIGDAWSDVQAGVDAGVPQTVLVRTGRGQEQLSERPSPHLRHPLIFDHVAAAVEAILARDGQKANDAPG
jgi:D-glycero-D-manno-heptose 1,7-bisphosphate phosphatase